MALTLAIITASEPASAAQAASPENQVIVGELVVGTKEAPPFAMKDSEGNWSGISIDLWRQVADRLKLRYHFVDVVTVTSLLEKPRIRAFRYRRRRHHRDAGTPTTGRFHHALFPHWNRGRGASRPDYELGPGNPLDRILQFFASRNGVARSGLFGGRADLVFRTPR
jgi:hypothetical protein